MLLFDELAAALGNLSLDKYSALTLALSQLGIQVVRHPVKTADDGDTQFLVQVDLSNTDEDDGRPRAAKFDPNTRKWKLSSGRGRRERSASEQATPREDESWMRYRSRSRPQLQRLNIGEASNGTVPLGDEYPDWIDQIPPTEHNQFLIETDWASTELGPIEKWPASLRLMTRKMLADPRAANLYW